MENAEISQRRFETTFLAPAGFLSGRSVIAEPLGFRGERLGVGLFEFGQYDSMLVGELRQAISSSVKGALLTRALEEASRTPMLVYPPALV